MILSRSQIDALGERLRRQEPTEDDLRLLDQHRLSFTPAYERIVDTMRVGLSSFRSLVAPARRLHRSLQSYDASRCAYRRYKTSQDAAS